MLDGNHGAQHLTFMQGRRPNVASTQAVVSREYIFNAGEGASPRRQLGSAPTTLKYLHRRFREETQYYAFKRLILIPHCFTFSRIDKNSCQCQNEANKSQANVILCSSSFDVLNA